jgi:hypothetical protein
MFTLENQQQWTIIKINNDDTNFITRILKAKSYKFTIRIIKNISSTSLGRQQPRSINNLQSENQPHNSIIRKSTGKVQA